MTPDPDAARADAALIAAARAHFDRCRAEVDPFVARHFRLRGTLRLHRAALGWDLLRAPLNILLALPFVLVRLAALLARALRMRRVADWLATRRILLPTAVGQRVERLIAAELLGLPVAGQAAGRDALTAAVLAAPQVRDLIRRRGDPAAVAHLGGRVVQTLGDYAGTRSAVAEMTTALGTLGAGAVAFQALTPGMLSFAPAVAAVMAHNAAIAAFPLGGLLGAAWYGVFPAEVPLWFSALALIALLAFGATLSAFAGILADPVQARTGMHRRRLLRLIDAVEAEFTGQDARGFAAREHYLARLVDLADAGALALRSLRG
ncbi:MAG TPA: DUF6635 family protein [Paracoccaceae bacterium]|nr:DUF6635 family protein [Paracoccaceae bacterium]